MTMKVLVVSTPGPGHISPLRPLVQALIAGGDRVAVAAARGVASLAQKMGATFYPCGNEERVWFDRLGARTRGNPGDGLAPERISHYFLPRLFGEIATDDMIDDVLSCGREFRPDVVLFESYALAGPLVADLLGVAAVNHLLGPLPEHSLMELVNDAVSPLWRSFDREVPGYGGVYRDLTIEVCPPSFEPLEVPSGEALTLCPVPLPQGVPNAGALPFVYVTLGTFFNGNIEIFRLVVEGLAEESIEVVVTVGVDQDPAALAPLPANTRVERFIPQAALLPTCSAVVHHGGAGTMFGTLAHGLPQVVIPQGADNFINAEMVERAGVAKVLRPGELTPASVRDAVHRVLREPSYALAGRKAADEIATMAAPDEVASDLRVRYGDR
jgi:UDP:flavonoid glycosyltransferase YjiC (YdhE family)